MAVTVVSVEDALDEAALDDEEDAVVDGWVWVELSSSLPSSPSSPSSPGFPPGGTIPGGGTPTGTKCC